MKLPQVKFKHFVCVTYRSIQILEDQVPSVVLHHAEAELKNRFGDKYKNWFKLYFQCSAEIKQLPVSPPRSSKIDWKIDINHKIEIYSGKRKNLSWQDNDIFSCTLKLL